MLKKIIFVREADCVACGSCEKVCPRQAIAVYRGCFARVKAELCVGCGLCAKACPAECLELVAREGAQ